MKRIFSTFFYTSEVKHWGINSGPFEKHTIYVYNSNVQLVVFIMVERRGDSNLTSVRNDNINTFISCIL
jgi:hypothetical protein